MNTVEQAICFRNGLEKFSLPRTLDGKKVFGKWPDKIGNYDQQGDMLAFDYDGDIPKDAGVRADMVASDGIIRHIAHGDCTVYEGFIDARGEVEIRHPEHGSMLLSPGKYRVTKVMEYDHAAEEARFVID